eukprot:TRINITY_DN61562_c0_g1_i2.p3 TRINITY_DN61562_c0_g1~~TRINITY_DN61562_c0_g1_i2.p3  ORF type:complete len:181 (+),score=20.54 TRINITY_DN61562_c0_g1_i2:541-1083(+)
MQLLQEENWSYLASNMIEQVIIKQCEYWNCKATFHSSCAVEGLEGLYEGNRECYENCAGIYCKDHATRIKRKEKGCKEPVRKILEGRKNIEEHKHYAVKKVDESLPIEEEEDRMTEKSQPEKCGNIEDAHELLFKVGKRLPTEQIIDLVKKYEKTHQGPYSVTIEFSQFTTNSYIANVIG